MWMGPLSGMDVALLDQWQLLSHFLQNLIFRFLQSKSRIQFWLFEQKDMRIEGRIIGFDEYMNLVLDDAEEISLKKKTRKPLGRILLKGDNITLMMNTGKWDCGVWAIMSDLSEIRQQFEKRVLSSDTAVKTAKWDQLCMLHIQWSTAGGVELHAGNRSWGYPRQILSHRFCIYICLLHICEWNYHLVSLVQVSV